MTEVHWGNQLISVPCSSKDAVCCYCSSPSNMLCCEVLWINQWAPLTPSAIHEMINSCNCSFSVSRLNVILVEMPYVGLIGYGCVCLSFLYGLWDCCVWPVILEPLFETHLPRHAAKTFKLVHIVMSLIKWHLDCVPQTIDSLTGYFNCLM